ncbi:MAG: sugar ABC transporter permease [Alphaproteobacteria bacterium]|nr:sugar ABC transporter permease [Alphaproteobacteria bacterium]
MTGNIARIALLTAAVAILLPLTATLLFTLSSLLETPLAAISPLSPHATLKITFALRTVIIAITISLLYFYTSNTLAKKICPPHLNEHIQPWLFLAPTILLLTLFLIYPALETFRLSLTSDIPTLNPDGTPVLNDAGQPRFTKGFIGIQNYTFLLASEDFWFAIRNSILWLVVVPTSCIALGMTIAVITDKSPYGGFVKSIVFVPLAISFVGAAVIWRNIYAAGGAGGYQIGLVNALLKPFNVEPRFWYEVQFWGNFFMMSILIWIQTGFAMVIFSAALRGVPEETIEAARIDGASETQTFFRIILPQIYGTVLVVWTTLVILVLKVFDIPFALTANKSDKLLLATLMEQTRNAQREEEIAAAVAIILMLTIVPVILFNVWRTRKAISND